MKLPEVEWLISGEPREVQKEALRRSFYGYKLKENQHEDGNPVVLRDRLIPGAGWGHLMEMRLGKTPTLLNEFALFRKYYDFERMVVFSPNQYKEDWALEAEKYGSPVPIIPYEQSKLPKMLAEFNKAKGKLGFSVNYEALQYEETRNFLDSILNAKTFLAADESIKIKSHDKSFAQGAMLAKKNVRVTRIATGLPMTQGPTDFYMQGRFINMYDGLNFYAFRGRHCKMGGFKNKQVTGVKDEARLNQEITSCSFVAKRKDWGKQTDAEYYEVRLTMAPEQEKHYKEMEADLITFVENTRGEVEEISADQIVGKLMKMQQISSGFLYTSEGSAVRIMDPKKTPKMKYLLELLENEIDGKVVIPFHYQQSGEMLLEALAKYEPAVIFNEGWMKSRGRDYVSEKARFNGSRSCRVMIGNLVTMKYGHDLSGNPEDRCKTMFFFENNFSLDDRTQVEARNTTAFQDWANVYFDPYCSKAEKRAILALQKKLGIVEAVLGAYRDNIERTSING